jgi:hypothetical protein
LRAYKKKVLRRMFPPMMEELLGGLRKGYNEKLYNIYSGASIIRVMNLRNMRRREM